MPLKVNNNPNRLYFRSNQNLRRSTLDRFEIECLFS